jgi:hypothetical protein
MALPWLDSRGYPPDVWAHLLAGDVAVYKHNLRTTHPRRILVHHERQEYACATCGEVLYEGPCFTDGPYPHPKKYEFPPISMIQLGELRRHAAKARARASI